MKEERTLTYRAHWGPPTWRVNHGIALAVVDRVRAGCRLETRRGWLVLERGISHDADLVGRGTPWLGLLETRGDAEAELRLLTARDVAPYDWTMARHYGHQADTLARCGITHLARARARTAASHALYALRRVAVEQDGAT